MMTDIDVYGNTGELYVSVTSNLQIKQNRNLSKNWIFFDPSVLKIMSTYNVSFEKNVGILKHLQKKKRIFHLLKVSFEAPTRFYSNFFYGLWLAGKKKKKKKKITLRCPINAARPHRDCQTNKTKSLPVRRKDHLRILWILLLLWLISIWWWSFVKDLL